MEILLKNRYSLNYFYVHRFEKKGSKFAISTLSEACWFGKRNIPRQLLAGPLSFCRRWPWCQTLGFSRYWPQCFVPSPPHRLSLRMGPLLNQTKHETVRYTCMYRNKWLGHSLETELEKVAGKKMLRKKKKINQNFRFLIFTANLYCTLIIERYAQKFTW